MKKFIEFAYPEEAKVSKEVYDARIAKCLSCHVRKLKTNSCGKLLIGSTVFSRVKQRYVHTCGCVVDAMAVLKEENCKLGKWDELKLSHTNG